jgi:hypothetical protein
MKGAEHEEESRGDASRDPTPQDTGQQEGTEAGDRDPDDRHPRQSKLERKADQEQGKRMEESRLRNLGNRHSGPNVRVPERDAALPDLSLDEVGVWSVVGGVITPDGVRAFSEAFFRPQSSVTKPGSIGQEPVGTEARKLEGDAHQEEEARRANYLSK